MSKKIILLVFSVVLLVILVGRLYTPKLNISGAVVPHHNFVAQLRAGFFLELSQHISSPKTIVLLSPNHYSAGFGSIQTTDKAWQLGQGQIYSNKNVVSFLIKNNLATNEPFSFTYEHGIYNILSDIHNNFPNAQIVPIIFKDASLGQVNKLEQGLEESCKGCFVIASVDFSHYMPTSVPSVHDERSIKDLQTLNTNDIFVDKDVDSGSALALLTMWAKDHGTRNFKLKNHTDSGFNTKNYIMEATTHVLGWYQK